MWATYKNIQNKLTLVLTSEVKSILLCCSIGCLPLSRLYCRSSTTLQLRLLIIVLIYLCNMRVATVRPRTCIFIQRTSKKSGKEVLNSVVYLVFGGKSPTSKIKFISLFLVDILFRIALYFFAKKCYVAGKDFVDPIYQQNCLLMKNTIKI